MAQMGGSQGFLCRFPRIFPYYFSVFVRVLGFFLEWAKKRNGCCWWGRNGFAFFWGGGEGDGRTDCFLQIFFPNPFVSPMQPKRQKVEPFLKQKKKKSFFLLLFLFQRQNGKSCSTSSGRDEAGFPSGMCKGCRLGDSPVSNRGLCPPRSGSRCRDINWISHLCPGRET